MNTIKVSGLASGLDYQERFVDQSAVLCETLWNTLAWTSAAGNRREYYVNDLPGAPYTYGTGVGRRTYLPSPYSPEIQQIKAAVEARLGVTFEACVLNGYADQRDSLGWHADDSPEVDPARPIAVVSLGAERDIMFRPIPGPCVACNGSGRYDVGGSPACGACNGSGKRESEITKLRLGSGSLLVMPAGCQQTHWHRIPKGDRVSGVRVSLTFRGYRRAA